MPLASVRTAEIVWEIVPTPYDAAPWLLQTVASQTAGVVGGLRRY